MASDSLSAKRRLSGPRRSEVGRAWHGYEFSVDTGECIADPEHVRVPRLDVGAEDGMVVIERRGAAEGTGQGR